jgi:hypothetical protein
MRLRTTLLHVAVLLTAACGGSTSATGSSDAGADGSHGNDASNGGDSGGGDASKDALGVDVIEPAEGACGGCNCGQPPTPNGNASPDEACAIASGNGALGSTSACETFCTALNDGGTGFYYCSLPTAYTSAYQAAVGDAGPYGDGGPDSGLRCPAWQADVVVQCGFMCTGRRTDGIPDHPGCDARELGDVFAARAYLEEVSVHAFDRMLRELRAHGAPPSLLRDARRARRDEVRHTAMMARLARRFGGEHRSPVAPDGARNGAVRPLRAIAIENAVEGCVRETYGAVVGLVEARASSDPAVRRAMASIAADECRHAELSWAVARWILPRLGHEERALVASAMRRAIDDLARTGDARAVAMLDAEVWNCGSGRPLAAA